MLVRDVDPDVAAHLDPDFVTRLLGEIDYCDQTDSPPTKAIQTHALLFSFAHNAPNHGHPHLYKGLLVYSPPISSLSLGTFSGTGCLVAHTANQAAVDEVGTVQAPVPWVRIGMGMRRSGAVGPDGFHTVSITAGFHFLDVGGSSGGPGGVRRYFEADLTLRHEQFEPPHLRLTDTTAGDGGVIRYTKSTVVP